MKELNIVSISVFIHVFKIGKLKTKRELIEAVFQKNLSGFFLTMIER